MDPMRFAPRPMSPSSVNTRSSFQSRARSPLSISSSIDHETGRLSEDSGSSLGSYNGKPDFAPTRMPPKSHWQQKAPEAIAPLRYGAGGAGRQQSQAPSPFAAPQMGRAGLKKSIPSRPGDGFRRLPHEVLLVILAELKKLHMGRGCVSCSTCWMRETLSVGSTCKKWWEAAKVALYEDIQLIGNDSLLHTKKKFKIKHGTRLKLLRRTLRAHDSYAFLVKSLKVPSMPETAKTKQEQDEYLDLIASLIMACPNLERLPGFYTSYNHEFSRFTQALSTRTKLREMVWMISPGRFQRQHRYNISGDGQKLTQVVALAPALLLPQQSVDFITYHSNWSNLDTLFMHCTPNGVLDSLLIQDVLYSLPQLKHLQVSNFPVNAFNDDTLVSLPPLTSLRLDRLPGITSEGLSAFVSRRRNTLQSLSLVHVDMTSLAVLARMLSNFRSLTRLTILQAPAPSLPLGEVIFLHPYLASFSLEYLHWELTNPDNDTATGILSKSIAFGGFPALKTIRAPTDFEGLLQSHCRPREKIELSSDRYRNLYTPNTPSHPGLPHSHSTASLPSPNISGIGGGNLPSPTRSTFSLGHSAKNSVTSLQMKSPTHSHYSTTGDYFSYQPSGDERAMSLATARRMAQQRLESALTHPKFHIIVWDDNGQFLERFEVGGYMGHIGSKIFYSLRPDVDGIDEAVVQFDGVGGLLDGGDETNGKEGCTGSWYTDIDTRKNGKMVARKKEDWWHTERGRWKELPLDRFF